MDMISNLSYQAFNKALLSDKFSAALKICRRARRCTEQTVFSKEEVKAFIIRLGEKCFFPDFTNKLTWYVVTLSAGFILIPQPIKLFVINWAIEVFNVNSGLKMTLPEMEARNDYATGLCLIFMALAHNIGYKYFGLKQKIFEHKIRQERRISDTNLLERFVHEFSSNCPSAVLL